MRYGMAVDTKKCVGCSDCVVACQTENKVPIGYCREWVVEVTDGTYPQLEIEIRSERCNHCANAPCVRCCPTGASHIEDGGIVLVTSNECIGCGACIACLVPKTTSLTSSDRPITAILKRTAKQCTAGSIAVQEFRTPGQNPNWCWKKTRRCCPHHTVR